jgi:hypothetical protein
MSVKKTSSKMDRVFGLNDWIDWLGTLTSRLFGLTAAEFESAYARGELRSGTADDLASVLPLIRRLREQID